MFHNAFSKGVIIDDILRGHGRKDHTEAVKVIEAQAQKIEQQSRQIEELSGYPAEILSSDRPDFVDELSREVHLEIRKSPSRIDSRPIPETVQPPNNQNK